MAVLYGHRQSFRNNNLRTATELSKHIWDLKDRQEEFEISWKIIDGARSYNGTSNRCRRPKAAKETCAIAVCSCIGKLLFIMLLERLTSFRLNKASDPNNQCGFTKGRQCKGHIFTLLTVLQKYKKLKKKVHAVFVDLRKAFYTVNRQALLFKLALEGINGGFFNLIRSMYESSSAVVKINGRISESFAIGKGTEKGHPLNPDLFKVYFRDLSILLNDNNQSTSPNLNGIPISHLAWAGDVVILAVDEKSIQSQLSVLSKYCSDWGLEINLTKTKYMVMNSKKKDGIPSPLINSAPLERVSEYCYLGIIVTASGSLERASQSLSNKGLGAMLNARNFINRTMVPPKVQHNLFMTLVTPIINYGYQVWLPSSSFIKSLIKNYKATRNLISSINLIFKQPFEKVQLRHLKYILGISRKATNVATTGETGVLPLFIKNIELCLRYLINLVNQNGTSQGSVDRANTIKFRMI